MMHTLLIVFHVDYIPWQRPRVQRLVIGPPKRDGVKIDTRPAQRDIRDLQSRQGELRYAPQISAQDLSMSYT